MRRWEFVYNAWVSADQGKAAVAQANLVQAGLSMEEMATQQAQAAEAYARRVAPRQNDVAAHQTTDADQPTTSQASCSHSDAASNAKSDQTLLPNPEAHTPLQQAHMYNIAVTTGTAYFQHSNLPSPEHWDSQDKSLYFLVWMVDVDVGFHANLDALWEHNTKGNVMISRQICMCVDTNIVVKDNRYFRDFVSLKDFLGSSQIVVLNDTQS